MAAEDLLCSPSTVYLLPGGFYSTNCAFGYPFRIMNTNRVMPSQHPGRCQFPEFQRQRSG